MTSSRHRFFLAICVSLFLVAMPGCGVRVIPSASRVSLTNEGAAEIRAQFEKFFESVSAEDYLRLRELIVAAPGYDPYSADLEKVEEFVALGRREDATAALEAAFPNLLLSPRAHILASQIARENGDEELAAIEGLQAAICLEGILRTGAGDATKPYVVTRPSDEYDVIVYLDKRITGQRLQQQDGRQFDLLVLDDGSEVWFDVTAAFDTIGGKFMIPN